MNGGGGLSRPAITYLTFTTSVNATFLIFTAYYIIYLQANGLSFWEMGLIFGFSAMMTALFDFPTGNLADKYGRRKSFAVGTAMFGIGALVYGLSGSFSSFLVAEAVMGIGAALVSGAPEAWVVDQLQDNESEINRVFPMGTGLRSIVGIGAGVMASILVAVSLNLPFLVGGAMAISVAGLSMLFMEENYGDHQASYVETVKRSLGFFSTSRPLILLTIAEVTIGTVMFLYLFLYQPYLVSHGLGQDLLGVYYSLLMVATTAGAWVTGRLIGRRSNLEVLTLGCILLALAFLGLSLLTGLPAVGSLFILCGFANGLTYPAIYVWRNELIPSRIRASVLSIMSTFVSVSAALLMMAIGGLVDILPMTSIFMIGVAFSLLSVAWLFTTKQSQGRGSDTVIYTKGDGTI